MERYVSKFNVQNWLHIYFVAGETKAIDGLKIANLMPDNKKQFYFYDGSLTTPECNQAVKWIVFKDEICISALQVCFNFFKKY